MCIPAGSAGPVEMAARAATRTPTSTYAGGQDDASFANFLKIAIMIIEAGIAIVIMVVMIRIVTIILTEIINMMVIVGVIIPIVKTNMLIIMPVIMIVIKKGAVITVRDAMVVTIQMTIIIKIALARTGHSDDSRNNTDAANNGNNTK